MDPKAQELLEKYGNNTCTPEEKALVEQFYMLQFTKGPLPDANTSAKKEIWNRIQKEKGNSKEVFTLRKKNKQRYRWPVAAAVAALLIVYTYFIFQQPADRDQLSATIQNPIVPGSHKAILTLGNGQKITLSNSHQGIVIGDSIRYENGEYLSTISEGQLLTLETPAGGQYHVTLPDGTVVWLNAASTLRYPQRFSAKERLVKLEGEAYFDVTKRGNSGTGIHGAIPFRVESPTQTVEVLGTQFNISAYANDPHTVTTLLEGRVAVLAHKSSVILKPGQQALVTSERTTILEVDASQFTDWKAGLFNFSDEKLESILRKVARWYNVSIQYQDESVKDDSYLAVLPRYAEIDKLLKVLEDAGNVSFQTKGRTIIVKRKNELLM